MQAKVSVRNDFLVSVRAVLDAGRVAKWPDASWRSRPEEFANLILGVRLWSFQLDVLDTVLHARHTAVAGGRKNGKSLACAIVALWFWCSHPGAKVILYAPKLEQIDEIIYAELKKLWREHGQCVACREADPEGPRPCPHSSLMAGKLAEGCKNGLRAADGRSIFGMVSNSGGGGLRGISGANILAIEDEACEIEDADDQVIVGNLASANAKRLITANPTKSRGFMYRAFHNETAVYVRDDGRSSCLSVSTEDNPNVIEGREVFPGLGSRQWLLEREMAWGRGSRMWQTDVEGKFPKSEEGQLFAFDLVQQREREWLRTRGQPVYGRLFLGVDVAGEGRDGDESTMCLRRASRVLCPIFAARGLSADALLMQAVSMLKEWRIASDINDERPVVVIDRDGETGARVFDAFMAHSRNNPSLMVVREFRGSPRPPGRMGETYKLNRDLLFGGLAEWVRDGGVWPEDLMLRADLDVYRWLDNELGKQVLIRKTDIKKILKRSPDRGDALALSTWGNLRQVFQTPDPSTPEDARREQAGYSWHEPEHPWDALREMQGGGRRRGHGDDD